MIFKFRLKLFIFLFLATLVVMLSGCPKKKTELKPPSLRQEELDLEKKRLAEEKKRLEEEQERLRLERERMRAERERRRLREAEDLSKLGAQQARPKTTREEVVKEGALQDIHFSYDKSDIQAKEMIKLQQNAEWLRKNPAVKILIEGHCDENGSNEYNIALGERRALSTKRYLMSLGISADRIYTISYGEELPVDPRSNEEAWAKNRRAHFMITSK